MLLVDSAVLPATILKVLEAKRLLSTAGAKTSSEAARMSGISRSAFYRYKDCVFDYNDRAQGNIITLHAILRDQPGVLGALIRECSQAGANILTLNQSIPQSGAAAVSMSIRTPELKLEPPELVSALSNVPGVIRIEQILGE